MSNRRGPAPRTVPATAAVKADKAAALAAAVEAPEEVDALEIVPVALPGKGVELEAVEPEPEITSRALTLREQCEAMMPRRSATLVPHSPETTTAGRSI